MGLCKNIFGELIDYKECPSKGLCSVCHACLQDWLDKLGVYGNDRTN